jgi:hypothetical protein
MCLVHPLHVIVAGGRLVTGGRVEHGRGRGHGLPEPYLQRQ